MIENPKKTLLNQISDALSNPENLLKTIPGVTGAVVLILKDYSTNKFAFTIGVSLIILSLLLLSLKWVLNYRRPAKIGVEDPGDESVGAFIRGLLPFGERDFLLGRNNERKRANAIIGNAEFRFGYISGEAGAGKTSFLRSILISEIRHLGMTPIYVSEVKNDPIEAILTAMDIEAKSASIESYLKNLQKNEKKRIVIIIDQFEEFFVNVRSTSDRNKELHIIAKIVNDRSLNTCILLAIRKEFVDDLQEFAPDIEQPTDSRYSVRIKNWDEETARSIFDKMVEADKIAFAPQLRVALISDLADNGIVRRVELQIVAKIMADEGILNLELYKLKDRAKGILANYVRSIINPENKGEKQAEPQITKFILKSLCDEKNDTKRVKGFTAEEFRDNVKELLPDYKEKELSEMLDKILDRLVKQRVLRMEDIDRYNLIHDYLVLPIRIATADLETITQSADRLLNKYIELNTTIPRRTLRMIVRDATPELKTSPNAKKIINKTRRNIFMINISPVLLLSFFVWLFPPQHYFLKRSIYEGYNVAWESAENGHILVGSARDSLGSKSDSTAIWINDQNVKLLQKLKPCLSFLMSKDGRWICLVDSFNISLYENIKDSEFIERYVIAELPLNFSREKSFKFSPSSHVFAATGKMGNFYAINLQTEKRRGISPLFKSFDTSMHIWSMSNDFSPNEKFVSAYRFRALSDGKVLNDLVYIPTEILDTNSIRTIVSHKVDPKNTSFSDQYTFGSNDQTIYYSYALHGPDLSFENQWYSTSIYKLDLGGSLPVLLDTMTALYHSTSRKDYDLTLSCSKDGKWLMFRSNRGPVHITDLESKQTYNLTDSNLEGYRRPTFFIDQSVNYCGFNDPQGNYYLLNIKNIPSSKLVTPIFKTAKNAGNNEITPVFDSTQQFVMTNNLNGHVFVFSKDSIPQRPILFFDKEYKIHMIWTNGAFVYVFANNNIRFGNPFGNEAMDGIREDKINSEIQDIAINRDHSQLLLLTQTGLIAIENKLRLWNLVNLRSYGWPSIYRRSDDN
jgi:hypothetical protein